MLRRWRTLQSLTDGRVVGAVDLVVSFYDLLARAGDKEAVVGDVAFVIVDDEVGHCCGRGWGVAHGRADTVGVFASGGATSSPCEWCQWLDRKDGNLERLVQEGRAYHAARTSVTLLQDLRSYQL